LNGKTKEEWYQMIADRVANGDGPCAPPEYAEFKGPGVHHRFDNDSPDEYDMDMEQRSRMLSGHPGRVILLGDGTEIMTDSGENDTDMFDQSDDEEKDLASQVSKGQDEGKNGSQEQGTGVSQTPAEPKMGGVQDSA
ncbi:protein phosphatase, partial [Aureobasidium melanogenum]